MPDFTPLHVPARLADLEFTVDLHKDFREVDLPAEDHDFSEPTVCAPLLVTLATYGAIVFGVAARPAYENGTLTDWCSFFCQHNHFQVEAMGAGLIGDAQVIFAHVTQQSEAVPLRLRVAAMEDGGRLILLSAMAPEPVWASVKDTLLQMLMSFRLARPKGRSIPLSAEEPR